MEAEGGCGPPRGTSREARLTTDRAIASCAFPGPSCVDEPTGPVHRNQRDEAGTNTGGTDTRRRGLRVDADIGVWPPLRDHAH